MCQKVSKACGALAKLRHCVNTNVLREFYHSLFHSYVKYGILVWGNASHTSIRPLQVLMNKALKIMTFSPFGRIDIKPLYDYLKILDIQSIFSLETGKFVFKEKRNLLPVRIGDYFSNKVRIMTSSYNLRSNSLPLLSYRLSTTEQKSISSRGQLVWNRIPDNIRFDSPSFLSFKYHYKEYLFDQMYMD